MALLSLQIGMCSPQTVIDSYSRSAPGLFPPTLSDLQPLLYSWSDTKDNTATGYFMHYKPMKVYTF